MSHPESRRRRRERLARSGRKARHRRVEHLRAAHPAFLLDPSPANVDCACELARLYFDKRRARGCDCVKSRRGNPKIGRGICSGKKYRVAVLARQQIRRVLRSIEAGRRSAEDLLRPRFFWGFVDATVELAAPLRTSPRRGGR